MKHPVPNSALEIRVPFVDTDAMGVVHHSNYIRYLEVARVKFLEEHDMPYVSYLEMGFQFAVTRVDVRYKKVAKFDDRLVVRVWVEWVKNVSLGFAYEVSRGDEIVTLAKTEHASVDNSGTLTRLPKPQRNALRALLARPAD